MDLTRRRLLAAVGGVGAAALAGCTAADAPRTDGGSDDGDGGSGDGGAGGGGVGSGGYDDAPAAGEVLRADVTRELPSVPDDDVAALVAGATEFTLALHRQLAESGTNLFVSPYSLSLALAMPWGGARGETEREMAATLGYPFGQDRLHPTMNALDRTIRGADDGERASDGAGDDTEAGGGGDGNDAGDRRPFTLRVANATWAQADYPFEQAYLELLARHYGAGVRTVNFRGEPDAARNRINEWVSTETEGTIADLLPSGSVTEATRLVLANALYFEADWLNQFDPQLTAAGPFTALDGTTAQVPRMYQELLAPHAVVDGVEAVELPYVGETVSMVILLPQEGEFETWEASLDAARLDRVVSALEPRQGSLQLPRFSVEAAFGLPRTLSGMGMATAFDPERADFSAMVDDDRFALTDVRHRTRVVVDEKGTEAAAATGVVGGVTSAPQNPFEMVVDRPFLAFIRHRETGAPLFFGRVVDAAAAQ